MKFFIPLTIFITGAVIMVLEILGFRLLAPYFGYSVYVWGSLIGIIMSALSVGYYVGGKLADRQAQPQKLYVVIFACASYIFLVRFFFAALMKPLMGSNLISSTLIASLIIFGPPMLGLSMVSPFVIGFEGKEGKIGTTAGKIYGLSTVGSIFGTFLSAFYLVPNFGTQATLNTCFWTLLILSIAGLILTKGKKALFLLPFLGISFLPASRDTSNFVSQEKESLFDGESRYARLMVIKNPFDQLITFQSSRLSAHSFYMKNTILSGKNFYHDFFILPPLLHPEAKNMLLLGVAGGVSLRQIHYFFPQLELDAVEIDEKMIDVATKFFDLKPDPKIHIHIADARPFLAHNSKKYDLIGVDLYGGGVSIPFYVATEEFYQLVRDHLQPQGLMVMNISGPRRELLNTVAKVFDSVFTIKGFSVAMASPNKMNTEDLKTHLRQLNLAVSPLDPEYDHLNDILVKTWEGFEGVAYDPTLTSFTDDHSNIEKLTFLNHH